MKMSQEVLDVIQGHIKEVQLHMFRISDEIETRALLHDRSKMLPPEDECFERYTPLLKLSKFGSAEYKANLKGMKPALLHHHSVTRHHPESFPEGIAGMNLVDMIEMVCDWAAASKINGKSLDDSLKQCFKRFKVPVPLQTLIRNTAESLEHGFQAKKGDK